MTKNLSILIKLHRNQLNKILKEIEQHTLQKTAIEQRKIDLQALIEREVGLYSASEYSFILSNYIYNATKLIKVFDAQIDRIVQQIDSLRAKLQAQYSELKKFEIVAENHKILAQEHATKVENKHIDEFNISRYYHDNIS